MYVSFTYKQRGREDLSSISTQVLNLGLVGLSSQE